MRPYVGTIICAPQSQVLFAVLALYRHSVCLSSSLQFSIQILMGLTSSPSPFPSSHTVPPALPSNVRVSNITSSQVQVTWSLTHQHVDERAKSLMLIVQFSNGTIAQQYQLDGNATQQMVDTVPGMEYRVIISASNQDGTRTTDPVPFQTHPGRKHLHMWITV